MWDITMQLFVKLLLPLAILGQFTNATEDVVLSREKRIAPGEKPNITELLLLPQTSMGYIRCEVDAVYISINKTFAESTGMVLNRLEMIDKKGNFLGPECMGQLENGYFKWSLGGPFGKCAWGVTNEREAQLVAVYYKACAYPETSNNVHVSRDPLYTFVMGCGYDSTNNMVVGPINPKLIRNDDIVKPTEKEFQVTLERYTSSDFAELDPSQQINVGEQVFLKAQVQGDHGMILQGKRCWIKASNLQGAPEFTILTDGCPVDDPLLGPSGNVVYGSHDCLNVEFSFHAFFWREIALEEQKLWVFCELENCYGDDCGRNCDGPPPLGRKRRSAFSNPESRVVSHGPIHIMPPQEDETAEDISLGEDSKVVYKKGEVSNREQMLRALMQTRKQVTDLFQMMGIFLIFVLALCMFAAYLCTRKKTAIVKTVF